MKITEMTPEQRRAVLENLKIDTQKKIEEFKKQNPNAAGALNGVPKRYLNQYVKSLCGELTSKPVIKIKCLECSCWQREEIKNCTVKSCPLWQVRPYK